MFSAVASAFIIQVDPQLQPDHGNETVALLRLLIYKIDNATFENDVPALPQWAGPPRAMVQVQAILFASLTTSLFSAFLAMLGKQWLNRYQSTDMRGSAIDRSHNRQKKLGGIVAWYFNDVMESLPLMLQASLLLFGCALSRYLWEIDVTIASVVLGVTSFGVVSYLFIVIAGAVSESCPYQTPAAHCFRHILFHLHNHLLPTLRSAPAAISVVAPYNLSRLCQNSWCCRELFDWWTQFKRPWYSVRNFGNIMFTPIFLLFLLIVLPRDVYRLVRSMVQSLVSFSREAYHHLVGRHRTTQQTITMDLWCISWILQTSLDKAVHLSTLKYLASIQNLANFHPTLVFDCFNIFISCVSVGNGKVVIMRGLEQLATESADGFFRTFHHLATIDPASSLLPDIQRRYNEVFPFEVDFTDLPFYSMMSKIHTLAGRFGNPRDIQWHNYGMSVQQLISFSKRMVRVAHEGYQQTQRRKVPRWILRCALYFLSLGPASSSSVVADSLTIVAIDLGCDVPDTVASDERWVQISLMVAFLTNSQCTDRASLGSHHSAAQNGG